MDILTLIDHLKAVGGSKYSKNISFAQTNIYDKDIGGSWEPKKDLENRNIVILGNGPSLKEHKQGIEQFIKETNSVVICLNVNNEISPEYVNYQAVTAPWPVSNRDMIYLWKANRLSNGDIQIELKSVDYPDGPDTVGVRMKLHFSRFILNKKPNGGTRVTLEILSDPMGLIPKWVVNMIQKNYPVKFFRALKKQVKKPFVKKGALPK